MNTNGTKEATEIRNRLTQLDRQLQECETNIIWTETRRSEIVHPNTFQRKFFYELNEAYQREKRQLETDITRITEILRELEPREPERS